jgi:transposase-like protein
VLEALVNEMYARGLSTGDVEDVFRDATGELLISKSAVSEITDRLWEDYQAFITRDLADVEVEYLFVDAVFEALRRHGAKEAPLVAWCITADGRKHLLHLAVGNKESEGCWTEFFRNLLGRGLRLPTTVTSDGAPGLINAIDVCFPGSIRIRCWCHRLANIRAKLPDYRALRCPLRDPPSPVAVCADAAVWGYRGGRSRRMGSSAAGQNDEQRAGRRWLSLGWRDQQAASRNSSAKGRRTRGWGT